MSKREKKTPAEMTFFDHLDELRSSLWRALVGIFLAASVCYYFAPIFQGWLLIPFENETSASLALLAPAEGFIVRLKIALVAGLVAAAPWVFYQVWAFVAPGLFEHERKLVLPVVFFSSLLFITGAAFSLYVLPYATRFFLSFGTQEIQNAWSLGKYVDFVLRLLLAFGVVFELPLLIYFLARFGVVTPAFLRKYRRHMIVAFLLLAALITPPDVFTQAVLTLPMVILYEASILLAIVARKQYEKKHAEFMADDGNGDGEGDGAGSDSDKKQPEEDYSDLEDDVNTVPRESDAVSSEPQPAKKEARGLTVEDIRDERIRRMKERGELDPPEGFEPDETGDDETDGDGSGPAGNVDDNPERKA
ncbi:twin-arginine translocase subunit TatC [bacterium]|nr:twin-arginine translocase subunit TatC [bacterium]